MSSTIEMDKTTRPRLVETSGGAYRSREEIEALVAAFEACSLPRVEWTHRAHLTVTLWYLFHHSGNEATALIRKGIKRYDAANGVAMTRDGGYHETITLFWVYAVSKFLLFTGDGKSILELANDMIRQFDNSRLPLDYYSRDRLMSWEARTGWCAPDLRPLD